MDFEVFIDFQVFFDFCDFMAFRVFIDFLRFMDFPYFYGFPIFHTFWGLMGFQCFHCLSNVSMPFWGRLSVFMTFRVVIDSRVLMHFAFFLLQSFRGGQKISGLLFCDDGHKIYIVI